MSSAFLHVGTDGFAERRLEMVLLRAFGYDPPDRCGCTADDLQLLLGKSDAQKGRLRLGVFPHAAGGLRTNVRN